MKFRKDVLKLALSLSNASGIDVDAVYIWLMHIGKTEKINPCKKHFSAGKRRIIDTDNPNKNYLETIPANSQKYGIYCTELADYYEGLILERQDAIWCD